MTPPHGRTSRYRNHGCRCELCCKANTEFARWRGAGLPWKEVDYVIHEQDPPDIRQARAAALLGRGGDHRTKEVRLEKIEESWDLTVGYLEVMR